MKRFEIYQKLLQTDIYVVEAETKAEALEIYEREKGNIASIGSCSGWAHGNRWTAATELPPAPAKPKNLRK